jgi:Arc/MetJ-type ribon-helix-helix transcriptional regulator
VAKAKVSVTLSQDSLVTIDEAVRHHRYASRSAALDDALSQWLRAERRRQRNVEIDAYYDGQTAEEVEEELDWASLHYRSMAGTAISDRPGAAGKISRRAAKRPRTGRAAPRP